jgi:hypothetical protein
MLGSQEAGKLEGQKARRRRSWEARKLESQEAGKPESWNARKLEGKEARMGEERWEKLDVWKLADELAYKVYQMTRSFPKEEIYGITSQLRRATLSIPTNIVGSAP